MKKLTKPSRLNPLIEYNNEPESSRESLNEFVERKKEFYKPYIDKMAVAHMRLEEKKKEAEKDLDLFLRRNEGWIEMYRAIDNIFVLMDDSFSFNDFRILFEDAKNEAEAAFLLCENQNETGKYFIKEINEVLRNSEMEILLPGQEKEKINLLKYRLQGLKNIRDFIVENLGSERPAEITNNSSFLIKGKMTESEIEGYFMQLTKIHSDYPNSKKELVSVLTEKEVRELVYNTIKNKKYSTPNFTQQQVRTFIYYFKKLHKSQDNQSMDFVKFAVDNFDVFDGTLPEREYTNFSKGNVTMYAPYNVF